MEIYFNSWFKQLVERYNLPSDLNFKIEVPTEIRQRFLERIHKNEFGISFASIWVPNVNDNQAHQSFHEDNENHFHIDAYLPEPSEQHCFEIGVKTLFELAKQLQDQTIDNVQLTYSFQPPDLGRLHAITNNLHDDEDDYYISDRLSFHLKRKGQRVVPENMYEDAYTAFLTIHV